MAIDPRSGEVLAFVSRPAPDPNDFAVRVSKEEWQRLNDDEDRPLLNRVTQAQLAPGSVFKIIMATAMLESKTPAPRISPRFAPDTPTSTAACSNATFTAKAATASSICIVPSFTLATSFFTTSVSAWASRRISKYAKMLGLGARTGIDLPTEETGLVPSEEWVQRVFHHKWYAGSTISVAIGQGAVTITPFQIAYMPSAASPPEANTNSRIS